jgi:hypothetical protein
MTTITCNVSVMFATIEPWDVSNSVANLGPRCAELTWSNAMSIAGKCDRWLKSDGQAAVQAMRDDAVASGGWSEEEVDEWSATECLAYLVQSIASELRSLLNADDCELAECVTTYQNTDWDVESVSPIGLYYQEADSDDVYVDYNVD